MISEHHIMIVAKSTNLDLVVFKFNEGSLKWFKLPKISFPDLEGSRYFMCLPQHTEDCLNWLNGGVFMCDESTSGEFQSLQSSEVYEWSWGTPWMGSEVVFVEVGV